MTCGAGLVGVHVCHEAGSDLSAQPIKICHELKPPMGEIRGSARGEGGR